MLSTDNHVLLTHSEEYADPYDFDEGENSDVSWYSYELIVPNQLADNCELALKYCSIWHVWSHEYNDCQHYRLADTEADNNQWQIVTDSLFVAMAEFNIEYGHDLICYHE